jgi:hypothetical protein
MSEFGTTPEDVAELAWAGALIARMDRKRAELRAEYAAVGAGYGDSDEGFERWAKEPERWALLQAWASQVAVSA